MEQLLLIALILIFASSLVASHVKNPVKILLKRNVKF